MRIGGRPCCASSAKTLGLDLDEVAAALRIKPAYLAALEAGRPRRAAGRRLCDRIYPRLCRSSRARRRRDAAAFQAAIDAARGKAGSRFSDAARRAQHARRGNAAGRADPGDLRLRRLVLPVDRRRSAAGACRRSTARVVAVPGAVSNSASRLAAGGGAGGASTRRLSPAEGSRQPADRVGFGRPALLLPVRRWPRLPAATDPAPNPPGEVVIRATADSWIQIRDARQSVLLRAY